MGGEALVSWAATAGVGLSMLVIWVQRGGRRRAQISGRRLTPQLLFVHIVPAVTGLLLWVAYVLTDEEGLAWLAFGVIAVVGLVGFTNFSIWRQRRVGFLRATRTNWDLTPAQAADEQLPAEQHFPVGSVVVHGLLAVTTVALVFVGALQAGPDADRPVTGLADSIAATTATLHGTTGGKEGRVSFEYGQTREYGQRVRAELVGGDAVVGKPSGLLPASLYHYRLRVGDRRGPDRTFVTGPPRRASLTDAALDPSRLRSGGQAQLTFTLNAPATVRLAIFRARPGRLVGGNCLLGAAVGLEPRCTRYLRLGTVVEEGARGRNAKTMTAAVNGRPLPPGRYRAGLIATIAGARPSAPVDLGFTVRR
jgi:manganese efflux pump family protein